MKTVKELYNIYLTKSTFFCLLFHDLYGISLLRIDADNLLEPHEYCGVVVITTAQLHSSKPEISFCTGSKPVCSMSEIGDGEDL